MVKPASFLYGISYFKLGEYENASKYLNKFDGKDEMVAPAIIGLIGDCYVELGDTQKAITYFLKAANTDNALISPFYLKKAGTAYEKLGKYDKAIEAYTTIKDKYFDSAIANEMDGRIARAKALAGK